MCSSDLPVVDRRRVAFDSKKQAERKPSLGFRGKASARGVLCSVKASQSLTDVAESNEDLLITRGISAWGEGVVLCRIKPVRVSKAF